MSDLSERFDDYLSTLTAEGAALQEVSEAELQLALVLLLVQVLRADMDVRDEELAAVTGAVEAILACDRAEAADLMRVAAHSARDSARTRQALERLDGRLSRAQRRQLLEWLWRVALADAEMAAQEEYLIRKIAELLRLGTADVIEAKVHAKESFR
jgi:uncharacterized tellurite resistance protein B-like protein